MLTPLFKKPKFASTVGSMLTVVFGCLSLFTVLMEDFPQPLVWLLCLLSPSAFSIGIAQVSVLNVGGVVAMAWGLIPCVCDRWCTWRLRETVLCFPPCKMAPTPSMYHLSCCLSTASSTYSWPSTWTRFFPVKSQKLFSF